MRLTRKSLAGAMAAVSAAVLMAPAASAATPATPDIPFSAQGCSNNVCEYLSTPSGGHVTVEGWAYKTTFYGYFHFTGPLGLSKYAGPATWLGGKGNYAYIVNAAVVGKYCVHGYLPGGYDEGTVCFNVE